MVPSATLLINERSKQLASEGKKIYRLGFGQSPFPVPEEVVTALTKSAHEKDYLPVQGLLQLRKAVARHFSTHYGLTYDESRIMIGPGSKELILGLQMVCDADLLLPSPSWVSYEPQAQIVGSSVHWINTSQKENWLASPEKLAEACTINPERQKILILNYPSNPVGSSYSVDELKALAEVCRKYHVLVIADEIYGALTYSGDHHSLAEFYPEGTVVSGGLSKWCGAGGWRLGTFCFPEELRHVLNAMMALASESFSAVSAPVQYAAITAFDGSVEIEKYLRNSRIILKIVSEYVHDQLSEMKVTMPKAQGGFYLFPDFSEYHSTLEHRGIKTSTEFCEKLLNETGIALLPGVAFGRPENELTCRLSFVDFDGAKLLQLVDNQTDPNADTILDNCPAITESMNTLRGWLKQ